MEHLFVFLVLWAAIGFLLAYAATCVWLTAPDWVAAVVIVLAGPWVWSLLAGVALRDWLAKRKEGKR